MRTEPGGTVDPFGWLGPKETPEEHAERQALIEKVYGIAVRESEWTPSEDDPIGPLRSGRQHNPLCSAVGWPCPIYCENWPTQLGRAHD